MDHSGCDSDGIGWGDDASVEVTLAAIDALATRYGRHPALLGIELMNEPGWKVEWDHGALLDFYVRALAVVRSQSESALVVFNVLFWSNFPDGFGDWWAGQLVEPNVALDLHLYDCFGDASSKTLVEHIQQAVIWREAIERLQSQGHQVLVGEWSLATGMHPGGQAWASAQVDAFSAGLGWFFWSLKKEGLTRDDDGGDTWSLRGVINSGIQLEGAADGAFDAAIALPYIPTPFEVLPVVLGFVGVITVTLSALTVWRRRRRVVMMVRASSSSSVNGDRIMENPVAEERDEEVEEDGVVAFDYAAFEDAGKGLR